MSLLFNNLKLRTDKKAEWVKDILDVRKCMKDVIIYYWLKLLTSKYPKVWTWDPLVLSAHKQYEDAVMGGAKAAKLKSLDKLLRSFGSYKDKDDLLIPWNKGGDHWVLIHIHLRTLNKVTLIDSLKSGSKHEYVKIKSTIEDILPRIDRSLSLKPNVDCELPDFPQQTDTKSCGVCLMVNAEYVARMKAPDYIFDDHIYGFRVQIFLHLLYNAKHDIALWKLSRDSFNKAKPILYRLLKCDKEYPTMAGLLNHLGHTTGIMEPKTRSTDSTNMIDSAQGGVPRGGKFKHDSSTRKSRLWNLRDISSNPTLTPQVVSKSIKPCNPTAQGVLYVRGGQVGKSNNQYQTMLMQQCRSQISKRKFENCPRPDGLKEANEIICVCDHYCHRTDKMIYFLAKFVDNPIGKPTPLTPDTTIKQQLPLPSYKIPDKQLTEKIKVHVGIEATPPYLVRKQSKFVDLNEPKGQYRTLDSVLESDDRNQSFTINTKEVPGENIKVEFFQIFKLHNSKPVLRQYFDENSEQKRKFEKRLPKFMEFLYSEQEVPAGFLLKKKPRTQSAISSAREQPPPAYQIPGILNKMKQCTGIEEQPLYQVRTKSGMTDLCKTGKKYCTLLRVIESKCAKNGCHFTVTTVENQAKQLKVEFFQVLKLRNAKTILHEYFQNPNNSKAKEECDKFLPAFMKFLYSDSEVPESFIVHDNPESDSDS